MIDENGYTKLEKRLLGAITRGLKTTEIDGEIRGGWKADALATYVIPYVSRTVSRLLANKRKRR